MKGLLCVTPNPYPAGFPGQLSRYLHPAHRKPLPPARHLFAEAWPDSDRLLRGEDVCRARWRLLCLELVLRAYRLEHGRPAQAMADLVPEYVAAVPEDPFWVGQPPVYRPGGKPALYSVGPDLADDGGRALSWSDALKGGTGDLVVKLGPRPASSNPRP